MSEQSKACTCLFVTRLPKFVAQDIYMQYIFTESMFSSFNFFSPGLPTPSSTSVHTFLPAIEGTAPLSPSHREKKYRGNRCQLLVSTAVVSLWLIYHIKSIRNLFLPHSPISSYFASLPSASNMIVTDVGPMVAAIVTLFAPWTLWIHLFFSKPLRTYNWIGIFASFSSISTRLSTTTIYSYQWICKQIHMHNKIKIINLQRKNGCLDAELVEAHWPHLWQVLT